MYITTKEKENNIMYILSLIIFTIIKISTSIKSIIIKNGTKILIFIGLKSIEIIMVLIIIFGPHYLGIYTMSLLPKEYQLILQIQETSNYMIGLVTIMNIIGIILIIWGIVKLIKINIKWTKQLQIYTRRYYENQNKGRICGESGEK